MKKLIYSIKNIFGKATENFENLAGKFDDVDRRVSETLEHFDGESYEDLEDYEAENLETEFYQEVEHFRRKGQSTGQAQKSAMSVMSNRHGKHKMGSAMRKRARAKAGLVKDVRKGHGSISATFDIVITRNTSTIGDNLPVPLFASAHFVSNYKQLVSGYLPQGVSISSVTAVNGNIVVTYTDGTNTDTITITCNQTPYATFLFETLTDSVQCFKNRYTITNTAIQGCYNNDYVLVNKTLFGRKEEDQVTINSFKNPTQFQNGIIDIDVEFFIDKDRAVIHSIIPYSSSYSVQMSFFVGQYHKLNASSTL